MKENLSLLNLYNYMYIVIMDEKFIIMVNIDKYFFCNK